MEIYYLIRQQLANRIVEHLSKINHQSVLHKTRKEFLDRSFSVGVEAKITFIVSSEGTDDDATTADVRHDHLQQHPSLPRPACHRPHTTRYQRVKRHRSRAPERGRYTYWYVRCGFDLTHLLWCDVRAKGCVLFCKPRSPNQFRWRTDVKSCKFTVEGWLFLG